MNEQVRQYPKWAELNPAEPPMALSVLPGKLVAMTFGIAGISQRKYGKLSEATMPDTWIQEVLKANMVSEEGVFFLATQLVEHHRITLQDALDWIAIEEQFVLKAIRAGEIKKPKGGSRFDLMKTTAGIKWPALNEELALLTPDSDMRRKLGATVLLERAGLCTESEG